MDSSAGLDVSGSAAGSGWPRLDYEELLWTPSDLPDPGTSHRARQREIEELTGPYLAAVPPRIARATYVTSTETAIAASEAENEISRFDVEMGGEIAPFSSILLRTEAAASSQIENLSSSAKAIELALLGDDSRGNAKLIARNAVAMQSAVDLSNNLDPDTIMEMHRALLGDVEPAIAGRWRDCQVWIGTSSRTPVGADFVAPHYERVPDAIDDLVEYFRRDDVPILQQAAIAHAQFETIHPFPDGNGRTGRALIHAALRKKGLTRNVTVPVSAGLLTDVHGYHQALTAYREGNPDEIVKLSAHASLLAIENGRQLVTELRDVRADWVQRISARSDSAVWKIADLAIRHPVLTTRSLESDLGIPVKNATRYLNPLEDLGVLRKAKLTKRDHYWAAHDVLAALDRFAERAGRRRS